MVRQPDIENEPPRKKRWFRVAILLVGVALTGVGVGLMLLSFTSDETKLHIGLGMSIIGVIVTLTVGLTRDRRNHKPRHRRPHQWRP